MKKFSGLILGLGILALAGLAVFAAKAFPIRYLPGTDDAVTNLPADVMFAGGKNYGVSDDVPVRDGYEFISWKLDYATSVTLSYHVEADPVFGAPQDSVTPEDVVYNVNDKAVIASPLTTDQSYATDPNTGEEIPGTWSFSAWDREDFVITADTVVNGAWTFTADPLPEYTLTYHVEGDPVYGEPEGSAAPSPVTGIVKGSSVSLADPLSAPSGSAEPEILTIYYRDENDFDLIDPEVSTCMPGESAQADAIDIYGKEPVGETHKSVVIHSTQGGTWSFSGWSSDSSCSDALTGFSDVSSDMDVYGKWTYIPADDKPNEIVFQYTSKMTGYLVRYVDEETGELLCEDRIWVDIPVGTRVREYPVEIPGYAYSNGRRWIEKELVEDFDMNTIVFYYYMLK